MPLRTALVVVLLFHAEGATSPSLFPTCCVNIFTLYIHSTFPYIFLRLAFPPSV